MVAIWEHVVLFRQERTCTIHEVNTWKHVLLCDLLRTEMLFHSDGVVGAALVCEIVRKDHYFLPVDNADTGYDVT